MGLFNLVAKMSLNDRGFQAGIKRVESQSNKLARSIKSTIGPAIAGAFSIGAITRLGKDTIGYASNISDLEARLGVTGKRLQQIDRAGRQAGFSLDDFSKSVKNLARAQSDFRAGRGTGLKEAFGMLGVTEEDLLTKTADELFLQVGSKARTMENTLDLQQSLNLVFGRQGQLVLQAFTKGMGDLIETQDTSILLTEAQINRFTALGDSGADAFFRMQLGAAKFFSFVDQSATGFSSLMELTFGSFSTFLGATSANSSVKEGIEAARQKVKEELDKLTLKERLLEESLSRGAPNLPEFDPDEIRENLGDLRNGGATRADSLRRIGGFAAIGSKSEDRDRLVKMNQLLEKISKSTKQTADNTKEDAI